MAVGRLFVVEQAGLIRVIKNGTLQAAPYLDIHSLVLSGGERGLLSVAFDPDFKTNGAFYVDYTDTPSGNTVVARYVVSDPSSDIANPITVTTILSITQPEANHNGGQLQSDRRMATCTSHGRWRRRRRSTRNDWEWSRRGRVAGQAVTDQCQGRAHLYHSVVQSIHANDRRST